MQPCFQKLATGINVNPLLAAVTRQPELWQEIQARQFTPGSPHKDTESIFLRWAKTQTIEAVFNEIPAVDYPSMKKLPEAESLISLAMDLAHGTALGRVILVNLHPSGFISRHTDEGEYAAHYDRFHIALTSEEGNKFYTENEDSHGEWVHMKPGELWWFNNKATHWVRNRSDKPRLHLILDIETDLFRKVAA